MRGQIEHRARRQQIIDFSGLRYKNITVTDLDGAGEFLHLAGYFEIRNRVFIFIEIKMLDAKLPRGQELAFTRLVDAIETKPAIYLVAEHNVINPDDDVMAHTCPVRDYYYQHEWHKPKESLTLKEAVDRFLVVQGFDNYVDESDDCQ